MFRVLERLSQFLDDAKDALSNRGTDFDIQSEHIHQLAPVILDYTRMRLKKYPEQGGIVEVAELTLRFRESASVISETLHLLESQGRAQHANISNVWEILNPSAESRPTSDHDARQPCQRVTLDSKKNNR